MAGVHAFAILERLAGRAGRPGRAGGGGARGGRGATRVAHGTRERFAVRLPRHVTLRVVDRARWHPSTLSSWRCLECAGGVSRWLDVIDIAVVLAGAVLIAAILLVLLRALRGPPVRRWRRWLRFAITVAAGVAMSGFAAWRISKAVSFQLVGDAIRRVDTAQPVVALTFDDGPSPDHAQQILDVLRAERVRATFFVIGRELASHREVGRAIVAAGHELGNHSYSHRRMIGRSLDFMRGELDRTDAEIRWAGQRGAIQFRPPNGKRLVALPWLLGETDRTMVLWDVAPDSADPGASAARIVQQVAAEVRPGSIILMHVMNAGRDSSRAALPGVIHELARRGFRFVTVSELLAMRRGDTR